MSAAASVQTPALIAAAETLRVKDLHAWYGESHILHGMDFTVNRGECISLLGRNGAGRTTTLRAILGLTGRRSALRAWGSAIAPRSAASIRA
jgi:ABC-type branched-subunit amino acid transport system ATPase component